MLPSNKATWDIQRFLIINTSDLESESEAESSSSESDKEEATPPIASPELSEISKMILRAKAAAEVGVTCGRGFPGVCKIDDLCTATVLSFRCTVMLCVVFNITFSNYPCRRMLKLRVKERLKKNL